MPSSTASPPKPSPCCPARTRKPTGICSPASRYRPADALAAHLVARLASVMWRQARADRLEAEVLATKERRPDPSYLGGYLPGSPAMWDAARFNAVQRQQARLDRALFKLLDELDRLEPGPAELAAANDDEERRNEPEVAPPSRPDEPLSGEVLPLTPGLAALLARDGDTDAWLRFVEGRTLQADRALKAAGLPGLGAEPAAALVGLGPTIAPSAQSRQT